MVRAKIPFKSRLSSLEILRSFGTEAQCAEVIRILCRPNAFCYRRCKLALQDMIGRSTRKLVQYGGCRHQTSLTASTWMEHSKLPLKMWFSMQLICQARTGIWALAFKRDLDVSFLTAWMQHHKINSAVVRQVAAGQRCGAVQLADAYLGRERTGGKSERGSENKVPFVPAVSLNTAGKAMRLTLNLINGFSTEVIAKWAKASFLPSATVLSDGLVCFAAIAEVSCAHMRRVVRTPKLWLLLKFKWSNRMLKNPWDTLAVVIKALKLTKYTQTYLSPPSPASSAIV